MNEAMINDNKKHKLGVYLRRILPGIYFKSAYKHFLKILDIHNKKVNWD